MSVRVYPTIAQAAAAARRSAVAPLTWSVTEHLLARCTFGATAATRAYVTKYGPDRWYAQQVALAAKYPGYAGQTAVARQGPLLGLSPFDLRQTLRAEGRDYEWDAMEQLARVTLGLQSFSGAQLYEVLVDVFSNHLNVPNHSADLWNTRHAYDRDVIRKYVTGSFTNMLLSSAKSPAMLIYLNLGDSTKTAVNENYGRELLELHTVGLNYSEDDVKNAARLLTGRTLDDHEYYLFDRDIHATGAVKVLGFTDANRDPALGERAGDNLIRYLATHPDTARMLARKLCVRLVSDNPSAALVDVVAKAYLDGRTQILPMVSTILRTVEFWQSRGQKVRRPAENVHATVRALGVRVTDWPAALNVLTYLTTTTGNCPLDWNAPNGYPDVFGAWRSSGALLDLWGAHLGFTTGSFDGFGAVDVPALYAGAGNSGQAIDLLTRRLTGTSWTPAARAALQTFLDEPAGTALADSALQTMAEPLAALVLDAPHHALR